MEPEHGGGYPVGGKCGKRKVGNRKQMLGNEKLCFQKVTASVV
jgi:hypothetical protein